MSTAARKPRSATGAQSTSVYLTEAERELWRRVASERGQTLKETLLAGLRALEQRGEISNAELAALVASRLGG